jgi:hypothetical protein
MTFLNHVVLSLYSMYRSKDIGPPILKKAQFSQKFTMIKD